MRIYQATSPDISVIIPAFNASLYLGTTIDSVLRQTLENWELVIVDDGSTDNTGKIGDSYARHDRRIRTIHQSNGGVANARNRGFSESCPSSRFVTFLDNDDVWESDALERLSAELDNHPMSVAAHGLPRYIDSSGIRLPGEKAQEAARNRRGLAKGRGVRWPISQPTTFGVLVCRNVIISPGVVLIRRSALEHAAPFDAAMVPSDDWDMWCRLSLLGDITFLDAVVLNYRLHGANASNARAAMDQAIERVHRKLATLPELTRAQRIMVALGKRAAKREVLSFRLTWLADALREHQWHNAAQQLYHAARTL